MKKLITVTIIFTLGLTLILSACNSERASKDIEPPIEGQQPLLEGDSLLGSGMEPYPGPSGDEPVQSQPPAKEVEPYPEPSEPKEDVPEELDNPLPVLPAQDHEYAPKPGDATLEKGIVYIEYTEILLLESYPVQVNLLLSGNLPNPCHKLRVIAYPADDQNRIDVEVYSVFKSGEMCTQVLDPFEATIPLGAYTEGVYSVWLDREEIGTIELP